MSDAVVSRLGQQNLAGDANALFMKIFAGEVLTAFEETNIMSDKHSVRTIANGKSASFPIIGTIGAEYHTPGKEILGMAVPHSELTIVIDDMLISHAFIANIDEAKNHYDVRSQYSTEMGRKLAYTYDFNVIIEGIKAARATSPITGGNDGTVIKDNKMRICTGGAANLSEKALAIAGNLFAAAEALDTKNAPEERFIVLRPSEYYSLVQNKDAINRDWGGDGVYSEGKIFRIAGINILKCNHVPKTDTTSTEDPNYNKFHNVDASKTIGLVFTRDAIGTVKLMDLAMESEYQVSRQGTLMVAKYAVGHGALRQDCAVELRLDTVTNATA